MDECKHHKGFVDEIKCFHLEIIDRRARIEIKQDNMSGLHTTYQNELAQLYEITIEHGNKIAALDHEIKNLKWLAGPGLWQDLFSSCHLYLKGGSDAMIFDHALIVALVLFLGLNSFIAMLFWLHETLERRIRGRLQEAVERAVRAVEQLCSAMECPEKKQQAVLRVQALLGWYRWVIPILVIDTAIEAEVCLINRLHRKLGVDHDTPEEIAGVDGSG